MVILTKDRIIKFLGNKKSWQELLDRGWTLNVFIYTDGSNIDIVSPELNGKPNFKSCEDVTAEVSKWVSGKITNSVDNFILSK